MKSFKPVRLYPDANHSTSALIMSRKFDNDTLQEHMTSSNLRELEKFRNEIRANRSPELVTIYNWALVNINYINVSMHKDWVLSHGKEINQALIFLNDLVSDLPWFTWYKPSPYRDSSALCLFMNKLLPEFIKSNDIKVSDDPRKRLDDLRAIKFMALDKVDEIHDDLLIKMERINN